MAKRIPHLKMICIECGYVLYDSFKENDKFKSPERILRRFGKYTKNGYCLKEPTCPICEKVLNVDSDNIEIKPII